MYEAQHPKKKPQVGIFYRNFMAYDSNYCHVGLGINALHTVRMLRKAHVAVEAFAVDTAEHVEEILAKKPYLTHVILEAFWVKTPRLAEMLSKHPQVHFIVRSHSQIGFLQVEPGAIRLIREQLMLQESMPNLSIAANSRRLSKFIRDAYTSDCLYLPNLYDLHRARKKRDTTFKHRALRVGSFGALRLLKNHTTAAAAAMMLAKDLGCDLEFWVSVNREEHGKGVLKSLRYMFADLEWAKLHEHPWEPWPKFRRSIHHMDLCIQASMTETFNIVTADATAEGVPSVVSPSIEWAPDSWKANVDDVEDLARRGMHLLLSHSGASEGHKALERYVNESLGIWVQYLDRNPLDPQSED